jgi:putative hydrolase of the HAD superfamily
MIKAIILDFGSVIYKSDWDRINKFFKEKQGFDIAIKDTKDEELIRIYNESDVGKEDFKKFFTRIKPELKNAENAIQHYREAYARFKIINKELLYYLKTLKKKYLLFGFTDTKRPHYEANISAGVYEEFEKIFTSFEFGMLKTHKDAFRKLSLELKKYKLKPEECIFIDDYLPNIENAKKAGYKTIHYPDFPKIDNLKKQVEELINK